MAMNVALNGFGRIGKLVGRAAVKRGSRDLNVVAINDPGPGGIRAFARRFKFDSVHGRFPGEVSVTGNDILEIEGLGNIKFITSFDQVNWAEQGAQTVVDCSGRYTAADKARAHIDEGGAERVLVSAPCKGADGTFVFGVNHETYDRASMFILSGASCTTNCLAPVAMVLDDNWGIDAGLMDTIHAATVGQPPVDGVGTDPRRERSALLNLIPTTTGAARAVGLVLPQLAGKLTGRALRVPTANVSFVSLDVLLRDEFTVAEVHAAMKAAAEGKLKGILGYNELPLVSTDFNGATEQSIFDASDGMTIKLGNLMKLSAWYDNEFSFTSGFVRLLEHIARQEA